MGWNTNGVLAQAPLDGVIGCLPGGLQVTAQELDHGSASSSGLAPGLAIGHDAGWTVVWDPGGTLAMDAGWLADVSRLGRTHSSVLASVSTVYGFLHATGGALTRRLLRVDYAVADEFGEPLGEEEGLIWDDEERTVFELASRVAGIRLGDPAAFDQTRFLKVEQTE